MSSAVTLEHWGVCRHYIGSPERLGNRASNQKVAGSIPGREINDFVSMGEALHPTCLGEKVPVLTVSRSG